MSRLKLAARQPGPHSTWKANIRLRSAGVPRGVPRSGSRQGRAPLTSATTTQSGAGEGVGGANAQSRPEVATGAGSWELDSLLIGEKPHRRVQT